MIYSNRYTQRLVNKKKEREQIKFCRNSFSYKETGK